MEGWGPPEGFLDRARAVCDGEFRFLGVRRARSELDWRGRFESHLWTFHLHYFDYAVDLAWAHRLEGEARYLGAFQDLVEEWIDQTGGGKGDAWAPYTLSLRTTNWIYALLLFGEAAEPLRPVVETSLGRQLARLSRRLELDLRANHLLKNLKALVVGGLYFDGPAAEAWLRRGLDGFRAEVPEQVLEDGTHVERAPMYHRIAHADVLEVLGLLGSVDGAVPEDVRSRAEAMGPATRSLARHDGSVHLFNDSALDVAPSLDRLDRMSRTAFGVGLPAAPEHIRLERAGYFGYADARERWRMLVDCGEPGPPYQPGHAHCDLLSFELDVGGSPFVVDSGVQGYEGDELREYVRSTRAHNTVTVGGREQCEVWGAFRMARRPTIVRADYRAETAGFAFHGAYRPYHDEGVLHERRIEGRSGLWDVRDRVVGATGVRLDGFLHVHPDWSLERAGGGLEARGPGGRIRVDVSGVDEVRIVRGETSPPQGWFCPRFGVALEAPVARMTIRSNAGSWWGYRIRRVH